VLQILEEALAAGAAVNGSQIKLGGPTGIGNTRLP